MPAAPGPGGLRPDIYSARVGDVQLAGGSSVAGAPAERHYCAGRPDRHIEDQGICGRVGGKSDQVDVAIERGVKIRFGVVVRVRHERQQLIEIVDRGIDHFERLLQHAGGAGRRGLCVRFRGLGGHLRGLGCSLGGCRRVCAAGCRRLAGGRSGRAAGRVDLRHLGGARVPVGRRGAGHRGRFTLGSCRSCGDGLLARDRSAGDRCLPLRLRARVAVRDGDGVGAYGSQIFRNYCHTAISLPLLRVKSTST